MDYLWLYHSPVRLLHSQLVLRTYLLKKYNSLEKKEEVMRTIFGVLFCFALLIAGILMGSIKDEE